MYYVYLIQHNETKEFYVGFTENLESRVNAHNLGQNDSTKRKSGEWILIYYEAFKSEIDARNRERKLKNHGKGKQELLKRLVNSVSGV